MTVCPCGSSLPYLHCCRPWHSSKAAPTAEVLMRSRYSAYVLGDGAYLHRTWHSSTRPPKRQLLNLPPTDWQGLTVIHTEGGGTDDQTGIVQFIARYQEHGDMQALHETSRFVREQGRWYYVEAV